MWRVAIMKSRVYRMKIETWSRLPRAVRDHLVERMHDRNIGLEDLNQLRLWGIQARCPWQAVVQGILARSRFAAKAGTPRRFFCRANRPKGKSSGTRPTNPEPQPDGIGTAPGRGGVGVVESGRCAQAAPFALIGAEA